MEHFTQLRALLKQEQDADLQQFLQGVRAQPLTERVQAGYTWYPLNILQTGFSLGEKAFMVVERTTQIDEPHKLRAGQVIRLFVNHEQDQTSEVQGVINYVDRNKMKIILNARDVPEWAALGKLGIDMLFDDRSYQEMDKALQKVMQAKGDRLAELRQILMPPHAHFKSIPPSFHREDLLNGIEAEIAHLNASQQAAVQSILCARDVAIVHGPPGTGKTTTLVAAIQLLCRRESTVLVCAPSNTAADLLTERLVEKGLSVVRVGNISRIDEHILPHTLEAILSRHPESKNIKKVKIEAAECRRQASRYKRHFDAEARRERTHLQQQARELEAWANQLEQRLVDQILSSAQAITCTLVGAAHPVLDRYSFRTCVIDEAAQALEPASWIPIAKSKKVILAGDPFQLPPTVKSLEAGRNGLSHTLMERLIPQIPEAVCLLKVQYRMHQAIMGFSNTRFYENTLEAHASVESRRLVALDTEGGVATFFEPLLFIDTAGAGFEEQIQTTQHKNARSLSRFNPEEALLLREHLLQLIGRFPEGHIPGIAILSPYREQVHFIEQMLREDPVLSPFLITRKMLEMSENEGGTAQHSITVSTIDGFQGQERDVVYISLVRSNAKNEIGFLSDYRRMNVAMTRARMLLVVLGDSATIGNNKFYQAFLDYCAAHGQYHTAWEYMR